MKKIIILFILLITYEANSQTTINSYYNFVQPSDTLWYIEYAYNSMTFPSVQTLYRPIELRDSTNIHFKVSNVYFDSLHSNTKGFLTTTPSGRVTWFTNDSMSVNWSKINNRPSLMLYSDTMSISNRINSKLNIVDTTNRWQRKGNYLRPNDTLYLHSFINSKLSKVDTTNRWQRKGTYLVPSDTNYIHAKLVQKLNITDTTNKWQRKGNYIISETDPTVGSVPKSIIASDTSNWNTNYRRRTTYYNSSGSVTKTMKVWHGIVTPTSSNGYSIDISSAGFTTITSIQVQAEYNTNNASAVPLVSIRSYSTTAVVVNIIQSNSTVVSIIGINILGLQFLQNLTGVKLHVTVEGY